MPYYAFAPENDAHYRLVRGSNVAVFNDRNDPDFVGAITEITGLDSAEVRESANDMTQADGGLHGDFYLGRRPIVITGKSFGHSTLTTRNARLDKIERAAMALRSDATLSWKPSQRQENYLPNPSYEFNLTGWQQSGSSPAGTFERQTGWASVGTASLRLATTPTAANQYRFAENTPRISVTPGEKVTARAAVNVLTLPAGAKVIIKFDYYFNGAYVASSGQPAEAQRTTTGVGVITNTHTVPSGANQVSVAIGPVAGSTLTLMDTYIDAVRLDRGPNATTVYLDGDQAGYFWQGTPHASTSGDFIEMYTTVRRQQPIRFSGGWVKDFYIPLVSEYAPLFSSQQTVKSGLASGTNHTIENRGSGRSHPIIRIYGIGTNPYVQNTTTGETVRTTGVTLSTANDYIEIDTLNHTAILNGAAANDKIDFAASTAIWPTVLMGNNTFRLTNGGTMTVTYRDTWQNGG